jgi:4-hydroxybenzoate polyprenyltransferase/phosphoserine phosphatase
MSLPQDLQAEAPLYVDLDGTLIKTDLAVESTLALLHRAPWMIFMLPLWLLRGRAHLKAQLAQRVTLDCQRLPFNTAFDAYLRDQAARGRALYLATASHHSFAQPVAARAGYFRGVLASDAQRNLRGERKLEAILEHCPGGVFDYAGNARADLPIWSKARRAIVVNPVGDVAAGATRHTTVEKIFEDRPGSLSSWLMQLRVHQWAKNLLLGVPLLTAHKADWPSLAAVAIAFGAFCLVASATYMFNDLMDLDADRAHPRKRTRPFAAGDLPVLAGVLLVPLLLALGLALSLLLPCAFSVALLAYLALTLGYSFQLKRMMMLDVIVLAALYTIRIIAGAIAIGVVLSSWLLAFSMFVFFSLALVKRSSELLTMKRLLRSDLSGRDYRVSDTAAVGAMGIAAGYLSVIVLAFFVDDPETRRNYASPGLLWLLCPLMLYWLSRLWLKTARGEMHDDPLVFSMRDPASWVVLAGMIAVVLIAI